MKDSSGTHDFGGMTVNERLFEAGLFDIFAEAVTHRDREKMIDILRRVQVQTPEWSVDRILVCPERYGY